jgi:hypothetical protein
MSKGDNMPPTGQTAIAPSVSPRSAGVPATPQNPTREGELYDELYMADNWITVVRVLHDGLGLTQAEIARGAGVATMTVSRWLDSPEDLELRAHGHLDDIRCVVLWLLKGCDMRLRLIRFWLTAKNPDLATDPLTAVAAGRFEEVAATARAFSNGRSLSR